MLSPECNPDRLEAFLETHRHIEDEQTHHHLKNDLIEHH
jgi:hypothetical protein